MLDIGWTELAVVGVVALIVIGPKDLPGALQTAGRWVARARAMVRDFQSSIEEAAHVEEMKRFRQEIADHTDMSVKKDDEAEFDDENVMLDPKTRRELEDKAAGSDGESSEIKDGDVDPTGPSDEETDHKVQAASDADPAQADKPPS